MSAPNERNGSSADETAPPYPTHARADFIERGAGLILAVISSCKTKLRSAMRLRPRSSSA